MHWPPVHWHSLVWLIGDGTLLVLLLAELWSLHRSTRRDRPPR